MFALSRDLINETGQGTDPGAILVLIDRRRFATTTVLEFERQALEPEVGTRWQALMVNDIFGEDPPPAHSLELVTRSVTVDLSTTNLRRFVYARLTRKF